LHDPLTLAGEQFMYALGIHALSVQPAARQSRLAQATLLGRARYSGARAAWARLQECPLMIRIPT
jgi:hypothetical protein